MAYYSAYALSFDLLIKPVLAVVLISVFADFPSPSLSQPPLINPTMATECASRPYTCGGAIPSLFFPFWGNDTPEYCGHPGFGLSCVSREYSLIGIDGLDFRVLSVDQENHTMTLARDDLWESPCSPTPRSAALNRSFFTYPATVENLTLLHNCSSEIDGRSIDSFPNSYRCPGEDDRSLLYMNDSFLNSVWDELGECRERIYRVPVSRDTLDRIELLGDDHLIEGLKEGFQVNYMDFARCYQCSASNGSCGFDEDAQFECSCPEGFELIDSRSLCARRHGRDWKIKGILGVTGGVIAVLCLCITICCCRKTRSRVSNISRKDQDIEAFIRSNGNLTAKRYRFLEVKKITKSFKDKLGQGGYGEVYKGRLQDGRLVAVKLLNLSKGNGGEFINEVASISRTSHVNIVTLLGFCFEGGKRALIYEFMPNGSLEKFVYNDESYQTYPNLEWEQMLRIATGIARGLEYLHRGCNTRILHFDIKPHNILLDEDLCPKISDFGLAKLCPNKQSNISLLDARGTVGYVAPEVFNRNFGGVSSKSDVYSYGMMVLEMVGGRKNIKVGVSRTSQIYFPDWIYKQIKVGSDLRLLGDMTSEENGTARKMSIVGLWCIQIAPSDRPSMSKVIEMLEGSLEALQIPPKPTLISPRSPERLPSKPMTESPATLML